MCELSGCPAYCLYLESLAQIALCGGKKMSITPTRILLSESLNFPFNLGTCRGLHLTIPGYVFCFSLLNYGGVSKDPKVYTRRYFQPADKRSIRQCVAFKQLTCVLTFIQFPMVFWHIFSLLSVAQFAPLHGFPFNKNINLRVYVT